MFSMARPIHGRASGALSERVSAYSIHLPAYRVSPGWRQAIGGRFSSPPQRSCRPALFHPFFAYLYAVSLHAGLIAFFEQYPSVAVHAT